MKKIIVGLAVLASLLAALPSLAYVRVRSYYKPSIQRYVAPHYRSSPNSYRFDNYSYRGNVNPFTGKKGYKF